MDSDAAFRSVTIEPAKLATMVPRFFIPEFEQPVIAFPTEFKLKPKDGFMNGFFLLTRIAIYFFRSKVFGAPELSAKINILRITSLIVEPKVIIVEIQQSLPPTSFKVTDPVPVVLGIQTFIQEILFGVKSALSSFVIHSEITDQEVNLKQRGSFALKWRTLALSELQDLKGQQLRDVEYFGTWEKHQKKVLVLGPSFHPGNFAPAVGQSIAWETAIDSVCFQTFAPTKFSQLLDNLIIYSVSVVRIIFSDYSQKRVPQFGTTHLQTSIITSWWFIRSCPETIIAWLDFAINLSPTGCEQLALIGMAFEPEQFKSIVDRINHAPATARVQKFELSRAIIKPFPFPQIVRLLSVCQSLEVITIRGIDIEASVLFSSICTAGNRLRSIVFSQMSFRSVIEQVELPQGLLHLGLSGNAFSPAAMVSVLKLITVRPLAVPIILEAADLVLKSAFFEQLSELAFDKCHPNIAELDWSCNRFPADPRLFFAFLFTQKRLRLLGLNFTRADNPVHFLQLLMKIGINLPLFGLDFSGQFDPLVFAQFLQALSAWLSLRRLNVAACGAGDGGLGALCEVVPQLSDLNELGADGFRPSTPEALEPLWTAVATLPNIVACDLPTADMEALTVAPEQVSPVFAEAVANLRARARLSTVEQRFRCTLESIRRGEPEFSDEVFLEASQMNWGSGGYQHGGEAAECVAPGSTPSDD
jgi:hypothetical protein